MIDKLYSPKVVKDIRKKFNFSFSKHFGQNFLIDKDNNMYLIDWEYSAMSDPAGDIACFITCSKYNKKEAIDIIKEYFNQKPSYEQLRYFIAYISISSFYWFLWAINQEIEGKKIGEYLYIYYKNVKDYYDISINMYKNPNKEDIFSLLEKFN